jgi:phosphoglycerate dehydrogenase-like enzyme
MRRDGKIISLGIAKKSLARAMAERFTLIERLGSEAENEIVRDKTVMKIGIIGVGNIGGTLTRRFTALGHKVFVAKEMDL